MRNIKQKTQHETKMCNNAVYRKARNKMFKSFDTEVRNIKLLGNHKPRVYMPDRSMPF